MFGRRSDATLATDLGTMREFMPIISPRRNDSVFYYPMEVEVDAAMAFLEEFNADRPPESRLTLFHLLLRSHALMLFDYPSTNRFVAGGRLWQRDGVWLTYSAKRELVEGAPLLTVKRQFLQQESLEDMLESILAGLMTRRSGKKTASDKEMSLAVKTPVFVRRLAVWALNKANAFGVLPKSMIEDDPLFASVFIANVGSVNLDGGFHHLWEYGTISHFCVMGRVRERADGTRAMTLGFSYDERVEDGLYAGLVLQTIKERIEAPEKLR